MIVRVYRITQRRHVSEAFDGEGGRLHGGRWNSLGTRMVYTAGSSAGAILELLVHTEDYSSLEALYCTFPVEFEDTLIESVSIVDLPMSWNNAEITSATQMIGDEWVESISSAVLRVPSAIDSDEVNYLINSAHEDFVKLGIGEPRALRIDPRL